MSTQNLGTLYVRLNADSKAFVKGMASASEKLEKFAKETKKLANEVAGVSGTLLALGGAAVKLAADVDSRAAASMQRLTKSTQLLAVQVSDILAPAVESLSSTFRRAADWVASLDPETKKQIASWAIFVAQLAVAAKVLATVASLVDGVAGAFGALFKAIAAVGVGPILGIVAALAAVAAIVVVVHRAWRKNWGGIQEVTQEALSNIGKAVEWLADAFRSMWKFVLRGAENAVAALLGVVDAIQRVTGKQLVDTDALREGFSGLFKDLQSGQFFVGALQFTKSVASDVASTVAEEVAIIKAEIMGALGGAGGRPGAARQPSMPGKALVKEQKIDWRADAAEAEAAAAKLATELNDASRELWDERAAFETKAFEDYKAARDAANEAYWKDVEQQVSNSKESQEVAQKQRDKVKATLGIVLDGMGALGTTVNAIMQGMQSGGVWGALIAAIMEVFKRMESFQQMLRIFEYGLQRLGQMLEPLLGPIFKLIGDATAMGTEILVPLFEALQPLFEAIASALKDTLPFLVLLGFLFKAFAPIIKAIATILGSVLKVLQPVLKFLFEIAKVVLLVILTIINAIIEIWNGLIDAIAEIVKAVVDVFTAGQGGAAVAADIRKAKAQDLRGDIAELQQLTWDQAQATVENTGATWDAAAANTEAAKSARDVAESLTNVPSGYKVALARYDAAQAESAYAQVVSGGGAAAGGGSSTTTVINGDVNVNSDAEDTETLIEDIRKERARERAQRNGNPADPRD